jgi:ribosomal-protein-alanine N-acetyltransferase
LIERATAADLDAIDEIERHSFTMPWPRRVFENELMRDHARLDVARISGRVGGFCNYWIVSDEVHLLAIATHPDLRGRGIAGELIAHMFVAGHAAGCTMATLEVRRSNHPAIGVYRRAGFDVVFVRKAYYRDNGEDALIMRKLWT